MTSPPRPPLPPEGPPNSIYFSRRNATQPLPPSPERIKTFASSRNFIGFTVAFSSEVGTGSREENASNRDRLGDPVRQPSTPLRLRKGLNFRGFFEGR